MSLESSLSALIMRKPCQHVFCNGLHKVFVTRCTISPCVGLSGCHKNDKVSVEHRECVENARAFEAGELLNKCSEKSITWAWMRDGNVVNGDW